MLWIVDTSGLTMPVMVASMVHRADGTTTAALSGACRTPLPLLWLRGGAPRRAFPLLLAYSFTCPTFPGASAATAPSSAEALASTQLLRHLASGTPASSATPSYVVHRPLRAEGGPRSRQRQAARGCWGLAASALLCARSTCYYILYMYKRLVRSCRYSLLPVLATGCEKTLAQPSRFLL
eukprot:COSAG01_NODE_6583_length_3593_cov_42.311391_1_plen_180_part_00